MSAGTRTSPFWILLQLKMMEVVMTTGSIRRAKLQSKCHHHQTNTQFFRGRMPFPSPNQQCQRTEDKRESEIPVHRAKKKTVTHRWTTTAEQQHWRLHLLKTSHSPSSPTAADLPHSSHST